MKLIYSGSHDSVDVMHPVTGAQVATAERGKHAEVPDDVAALLLDRDDWRKAPVPKPFADAKAPVTTTTEKKDN